MLSKRVTDDCFSLNKCLEQPLTICIAAICESHTEDPKIVLCADRMITASTIQFEHGMTKMHDLTPRCMIMTSSNNTLRSDMIINNSTRTIMTNKLSMKQIVDVIAKECEKLEAEDREKSVLKKLGFTYQDFISKSREISDEMLHRITDDLYDYRYGFRSDFLIVGFDKMPHIYLMDQSGKYEPFDTLGFATIGSGGQLAFAELTKYEYDPYVDFSEALVRAYSAKKAAERSGGVGKKTDLAMLHIGETEEGEKIVHHIHLDSDSKVMQILNDCIEIMRKKETSTYSKAEKELDRHFASEQEALRKSKRKSS